MNRDDSISTAEQVRLQDTEVEEVLHWRFDELIRAKYDEDDAMEIAAHIEVDLHTAIDLRKRGCPSATAVRILV